jgi:membrane protease YdiL (CAAX protease family)
LQVNCRRRDEEVWADVGQHTESDDDDGDESGIPVRVPFSFFVLFEAALAPAALLLGWRLGVHPLADFAWDPNAVLAGVLAALPMLALLLVTLRWPVGPFARIKANFNRDIAPALEGCEWPDLALISVTAGVGEEMLFRGVIQAALSRLLGPVAGLVAASALFGLLHPISPAYIVLAGLLGGYLGVVWLVSGNLLTAIVAHAVYDFVALLILLGDREAAD